MAANLICDGGEKRKKKNWKERKIKFASIDLPMNSRVFRTIGAIRVAQCATHSFPVFSFPRLNLLEFKIARPPACVCVWTWHVDYEDDDDDRLVVW